MSRGGWERNETKADVDEVGGSFTYTNEEVQHIMKTMPLRDLIYSQYHDLRYISHVIMQAKKVLFAIAKSSKRLYRDPWRKKSELLGVSADITTSGGVSRSSKTAGTVNK